MVDVDAASFLVIVAASALAAVIAGLAPRQVRLPVVVIEIVLGILIGPEVLGLAQEDEFVEFFANLGLGMLFFFAGYEIEFEFIHAGMRQDQRERQGFLGFTLAANGLILGLLMRGTPERTAKEVWFLVVLAGIVTLVAERLTLRASQGVATAGSTLFRSIGGSIGVSLFGAIFANRLASEVEQAVPPGVPVPPVNDVGAVHALPAELQALVLDAFVAALHPVFLAATVIGATAPGMKGASPKFSTMIPSKPAAASASASGCTRSPDRGTWVSTMTTGSPIASSARTKSASLCSKRRSPARTQYQATWICSDSARRRIPCR